MVQHMKVITARHMYKMQQPVICRFLWLLVACLQVRMYQEC